MQDLLVEAGSVPSVPISESSGCDLGHMPASFGQLVHLTLHHTGSMALGERQKNSHDYQKRPQHECLSDVVTRVVCCG